MPLEGVTIRRATADDVDRLADIVLAAGNKRPDEQSEWRAGFAEWSRQTIAESSADNVLSVVMSGHELIGRLRVTRESFTGPDGRTTRCIRLAGIQLLPAAHNQGIGTSIISDLQHSAAQEGIPLLIGVEKHNVDARRLYERLGCRPAGETDQEHLLLWSAP